MTTCFLETRLELHGSSHALLSKGIQPCWSRIGSHIGQQDPRETMVMQQELWSISPAGLQGAHSQPQFRLLNISQSCAKSSTWWEEGKIHLSFPETSLLPFFTDRKFAHIVTLDHSTGKTEEPDAHLSCSFFTAAAKDNDVCMKCVYRYHSHPSSEVSCARATGQLIITKTFTRPTYFNWPHHSKQHEAGRFPVYPTAPNAANTTNGWRREREEACNLIPHIVFSC